MPRNKRIEIPGAVYHVIARGIEGRDIFLHDFDREEFLRRLGKGLAETGCRCYAWALMPNHVHLLIATSVEPLSTLMRKVLTGYALFFNRKYGRTGYLFQSRYKSLLCQEDIYFLELVRYIHLNPLIGGVVRSFDELENFWWTGHSVVIGKRKREWQCVDDVLSRFGEERSVAGERYRDFIKSGEKMGKREDLVGGGFQKKSGVWKNAEHTAMDYKRGDQRILGDPDFVGRVLKAIDEKIERREKLLRENWNLDRLIGSVCEFMAVGKEDLKKKGRGNKLSKAKALIAFLGARELGAKRTEIARYFEASKQAVGKSLVLGEKVAKESGFKLLS